MEQIKQINELIAIIYHAGPNTGKHTELTYNGIGQRVKIVERSGTIVGSGTINSTKQFVWEGTQMVEERNASNAVTKRFFPQGEQIGSTNYLFTRDHLGSVRELTNTSGSVVTRLDCDPWGHMIVVSGTILPDSQYAGMYAHMAISGQLPDLNLTLFRAYDPNSARWLSHDPIGEDGGLNLYGAVANDPINEIDPLGLWAGGLGVGGNAQIGMSFAQAGIGGGIQGGYFSGSGWGANRNWFDFANQRLDPRQMNNPPSIYTGTVNGAYAGIGPFAWLSNAKCPGDLLKTDKGLHFDVSLPWFSKIGFSVDVNYGNGIWEASIQPPLAPGPGVGIDGMAYTPQSAVMAGGTGK